MTTNPYASPLTQDQSVAEAEREIRFVIRVFRWIGWIGAVVYAPMPLLAILVLIDSLFRAPRDSVFQMGVCLANCALYAVFVSFLFVAWSLARRSAGANRWARLLCYLMMIGFPILQSPESSVSENSIGTITSSP